jgi:hypothetical protein
MATALDAPTSALDEHEQNFVAKIRAHGWFGTSVFPDEEGPGFTYTTGFWITLGLPEVILFSLKREIAHDVLWDVFRTAEERGPLPLGKYVANVFANGGAYFFPVGKQHYSDHLGWCRWFYGGNDFPCIQLVWGDTQELFPWQDGFEERFRVNQPDLSPDGWVRHLTQ